MDHVPVVGRYHRHFIVHQVLVQHIQGGAGSGSPGRGNGRSRFQPHIPAGHTGKPVQEHLDFPGGRSVVHRGTDHQAVRFFHFGGTFLDQLIQFAVHRVQPDIDDFRIDAGLFQFFGHQGQGRIGAAFFPTAAIQQ